MLFRERLKLLRLERGMTVRELAEASGVSVGTLNNYSLENDTARLPTLTSAIAIAHALGVSVAVFEDCDDLQPSPPKKKKT
jgi:transcriptional regulator with XRE-family HTH domain